MTRQLRITLSGLFLLFTLAVVHSARAQNTPPPKTPPVMDQMTDIPYFTLRNGMSSTLTLNNVSPSVTPVKVTIYNMEGKAQVLDPITLEPHSFRQIELSDVVAGDEFSSGNIDVAFNGISMGVTCQVSISNLAKRVSFESREQDMMDFNSTKLNGILSLPQANAEGFLAITNIGRTKVTAQVAIGPKQQTVALYSHQTRLLKLIEEFEQHGSGAAVVKLQHDGLPGEIITTGFVLNLENGYSSSFAMVDPAIMRSSHLAGAHLRIGEADSGEGFPEGTRFRSPLLLANVGSSPTKAHVKLDYTVREKSAMTRWDRSTGTSSPEAQGAPEDSTEDRFETVTAGDLTIAPGAVARVELSEALEKLALSSPITEAGVDVDYDAPQGSLIGHLVSVDQSGDYSFEVPIKDASAMNEMMEGVYPWSLEGGNRTVLHLKNATDHSVTGLLVFSYQGNATTKTYNWPLIVLQPYQTVAIDIQKIKDSKKPDVHGELFPSDVMRGQIQWRQEEPESMIGRAEQTNLKDGIARSFSCGMGCCYYYQEYDSLSPSSVTNGVGGSDVLVPQYSGISCNGTAFGPFTDSATSWSSSNTAVATCSSGTVSYVGAGSTTVGAYLYSRYYIPNLCKCQGKVQWVQAGASVKSCLYTIQPYNGFLANCDDLQHTAYFQLAVSPSSDTQACAIDSVTPNLVSHTGGNFGPGTPVYNSTTQQIGLPYIATKPSSGIAGTMDLIGTIYFNSSRRHYDVENSGNVACQ